MLIRRRTTWPESEIGRGNRIKSYGRRLIAITVSRVDWATENDIKPYHFYVKQNSTMFQLIKS